MNGKKYIENPDRERVCSSCGLVFSRRGIIAHSRNCDRDEPLLDPDRDARHPSLRDDEDAPNPNDIDEPESNDGVAEGVSVRNTPTPNSHTTDPSGESGGDVGDQEATTDGGRAAPPEPELDDGTDDPVDVDDLPDRYVPVEDYVDRKSRREDVDGDRLREQLSEFDVVDVDSYTGDRIEAFTLDELTDEVATDG
jgi:hypothetical protein